MLIRVIDVETTGLDPAVHRVCEVATVDILIEPVPDQHALVTRGRMWSSLVNPGIPIPPEASAVHDITDEMVKDAPTLFDMMGHVVTGPDPDYYCAHNSRFDSKFFDPHVLQRPWLDTYRTALWLWPSAPNHKLATLRYWLNLKLEIKTSDQVIPIAAEPYESSGPMILRSHRAIWDAYICAAVLRRSFMAGATVEQMVEVSNDPAILPRFTFGKHALKKVEEVPSDYLDWVLRQDDMDEDVRHTAFAELQRRRNLEKLRTV